jgi:hypothetical protein
MNDTDKMIDSSIAAFDDVPRNEIACLIGALEEAEDLANRHTRAVLGVERRRTTLDWIESLKEFTP